MKILQLFLAEPDQEGRTSRQTLKIDAGGVMGDKFHGKKLDRSILLTGTVAYEMAEEEGIPLREGDLGENILVDFDTRQLDPGDRLYCDDVVLEVTRQCTICAHLAHYDPKLPQLVKETRGVYLRVVEGGAISVGDSMQVDR
jgi:MOSC domain-containing protein YiiM